MTRENYHQADQYTPTTASYTPESSGEVISSKKLRDMILKGIDVQDVSYPKKPEPKFEYFCGPNCQHNCLVHNFEYNFIKNWTDPIAERPGIDFNIDPKLKLEASK